MASFFGIVRFRKVSVETVLSSTKYLKYLWLARKLNFKTRMVYVLLENVDLHVARVQLRVQSGGHDVPVEKIRSRHRKSIDMMLRVAPSLDRFAIYDNTDINKPELVASCKDGNFEVHDLQRHVQLIAELATKLGAETRAPSSQSDINQRN